MSEPPELFVVRGEDVGCVACLVCPPIFQDGRWICPYGGPFVEWVDADQSHGTPD